MIVGRGSRGTGGFPRLHRPMEEGGPWGKHGFPHGSELKASDDHAAVGVLRSIGGGATAAISSSRIESGDRSSASAS